MTSSLLSPQERYKKYIVSFNLWFFGAFVGIPILAVLFSFTHAQQVEKLFNWVDSNPKRYLEIYCSVYLVIGLLFSIASNRLAKMERMSVKLWTVIGFIFHLWAYLLLLFLCAKKINKEIKDGPKTA